jgi:hypothetical protein
MSSGVTPPFLLGCHSDATWGALANKDEPKGSLLLARVTSVSTAHSSLRRSSTVSSEASSVVVSTPASSLAMVST